MVNSVGINNFCYADTAEGLQTLINRVVSTGKEYGLNLTGNKTKKMIISKKFFFLI